ncbi:hypothetical protein [Hasllibacter sp. MH4015]|uniref:hypothetical protein n=1 Tax=Hasllibacter sp. MH4015 TaxID=2854029 RepID=UPI001CD1C267|nr:hypothetical protein [Hasllibacter sp. MH4015]
MAQITEPERARRRSVTEISRNFCMYSKVLERTHGAHPKNRDGNAACARVTLHRQQVDYFKPKTFQNPKEN